MRGYMLEAKADTVKQVDREKKQLRRWGYSVRVLKVKSDRHPYHIYRSLKSKRYPSL